MEIIRFKESRKSRYRSAITPYFPWDNLNNPICLNEIWFKYLGLPEMGNLDSISPYYITDGKMRISPYVLRESDSEGVIFRLGLFEYHGGPVDGFEYAVNFIDSERSHEILELFMKNLGFEFNLNPSVSDCVALAHKLYDIDRNFAKEFDKYFVFDEIPDAFTSVISEYVNMVADNRKLNLNISQSKMEIESLKKEIEDRSLLIQRILIDQHEAECRRLIENCAQVDTQVVLLRDDYNSLEDVPTLGISNKKMTGKLSTARNMFDGARHKADSAHQKGLSRIFGQHASLIDYDYMKTYLQNK